jgi:hypothetical protein
MSFVVMCGFGVFVLGVVTLIRPMGWITRRWQAGLMIGLGFVVIVAAQSAEPPLPATSSTTGRAQPARRAATPSGPTLDEIAAARRLLARVEAIQEACTRAAGRAGHITGRVSGYQIARDAFQACMQTSQDFEDVRFDPPISPGAADQLRQAMSCYHDAYLHRASAFRLAQDLYNSSDPSPSAMDDFTTTARESTAQLDDCTVQLAAVVAHNGYLAATLPPSPGPTSGHSVHARRAARLGPASGG